MIYVVLMKVLYLQRMVLILVSLQTLIQKKMLAEMNPVLAVAGGNTSIVMAA